MHSKGPGIMASSMTSEPMPAAHVDLAQNKEASDAAYGVMMVALTTYESPAQLFALFGELGRQGWDVLFAHCLEVLMRETAGTVRMCAEHGEEVESSRYELAAREAGIHGDGNGDGVQVEAARVRDRELRRFAECLERGANFLQLRDEEFGKARVWYEALWDAFERPRAGTVGAEVQIDGREVLDARAEEAWVALQLIRRRFVFLQNAALQEPRKYEEDLDCRRGMARRAEDGEE